MSDGGDEENAGGLSSTQLEQLESRVMEKAAGTAIPRVTGRATPNDRNGR